MGNIISRSLAVTLLTLLVAPASGADIRNLDGFSIVVLEGSILPGDYDKLRKLVDESCPPDSWNRNCRTTIFLASPGGSLAEAMKIGRLVRALALDTQIPNQTEPEIQEKVASSMKLKDTQGNYMCASACFFIAIAGVDRSTVLSGSGLLGIHRPYMSDADLKTMSGKQAMTSASEIRATVETYLKEMGVSSKYTDLMFSIPKDQVKWISEVDFRADFSGLIPELKDWMNARCGGGTDVEKRLDEMFNAKVWRGELLSPEEKAMSRMVKEKLMASVDCELKAKKELRESAWRAYRHF